ncbi:bestrophin family protein [Phaeobacter sp. HF9A]|uniref:bestrophin family protein n=1 Tax=Phaeobacter sp. HF9A TaxID=2721561 RepID=UPI0020CA427B|nr:bestrophin family protein [Phaeobacter sp. HF9A]
MIVRHKPGFLELLIATHGSVLPRILPRIATLTLLAALLVWVDVGVLELPHTNAAPFAVFGVALSLFLGFRNNAAYDRWWEGRRLWGQLVADMRALGREVVMFQPEGHQRRPLRLALAFIHLHRANLRRLGHYEDGHAWLDAGEDLRKAAHPPCAALDLMARDLAQHAPMALPKRR